MSANIGVFNFLLLLGYAGIMGGAQIIFANAAKQINQEIPIKGLLISTLSSNWLYLGLMLYIVATIFWLYMLTKVDIRIAYPIASTAVIFASLFQSLNTNTFPSITYWLGLGVVIAGLTLINNG